jgi:hypothetical protein
MFGILLIKGETPSFSCVHTKSEVIIANVACISKK